MYRDDLKKIIDKFISDGALSDEMVDQIIQFNQHRFSDKSYKFMFDYGPVATVILDHQFQVLKMNQLAGFILQDQVPLFLRQLVHLDSLDLFDHYAKKVLRSSFSLPLHLNLVIHNEKKYVKLLCKKLDGKHIHCAIVDESFEKNNMHELEVIGFKDYLTGLYNRRFFQEEMQRLDVERNFPIGLIMADVNGLKLVNDAFGHFKGDLLIQETANVLSKVCREDDIVARIGGDEFAIVLPKTNEVEMEQLLNRIVAECQKRHVDGIQLSIAFGASLKKFKNDDFTHVFKRAEDKMYKNKLLVAGSQRVDIINGIMTTLLEKHEDESIHSEQVGQYMEAFGKAMGFNDSKVMRLKTCGLLHDIGKIALDYSLIEKESALSGVEMNLIQTHAEIGYRILRSTAAFSDIAEIVLFHHERLDGQGYPRGLSGTDIPLESRMLSICDAYDAMITGRVFKAAISKEAAIMELKNCADTQFDRLLVEIFIDKVL